MRTIIILTICLMLSSSLSAQKLPTLHFEDAYFTNYHSQVLKGKLQKDFSTPLHVLEHLMRAKTLDDFSEILPEPFQSFERLEKNQHSNLLLFHQDGSYGDNYSCEIEYLVEFQYKESPMVVIGYKLFLDGNLVEQKGRLGRSYLIQKGNRWYLFGETQYEQFGGTSMTARLGRTFSDLNADNWMYLITGEGKNVDADMKEMRYFITDDNGINISKFKDLTLYWGSQNGRKRMEQFYFWPPCRRFIDWDESIPGVTRWFDRREGWTFLAY